MTKGRRPAGICGAALLLAARMNNFRRSVEEIVQVVKIADTTLKKRLEEFGKTSSAGLTVVDFRRVWLEEEMDPPAFTKGKEKELPQEDEPCDERKGKRSASKQGNGTGRKKRKTDEQEQFEEMSILEECVVGDGSTPILTPCPAIDPALFNQGILAGTIEPPPLFTSDDINDSGDKNIDPALLSPSYDSPTAVPLVPPPTTPLDDTANTVLVEEVSTFLQTAQGAELSKALAEAEERRLVQLQHCIIDELTGLDEEELDKLLLTEEEVKIKERVWVEMNREYLEGIAGEIIIVKPSISRSQRIP